MKIYTLLIAFLFSATQLVAQDSQKKVMDESVYDIWNKISNVQISNNGKWAVFNVGPEKGDKQIEIIDLASNERISIPRGSGAKIDANNEFVCFLIKPEADSIRALKRNKVKQDKMPKDTLGFYHFGLKKLITIPHVKSFAIPEKKGGILSYQLHPTEEEKKDTTDTDDPKKNARLIIKHFSVNVEDTLEFVDEYFWNKQGTLLAFKQSDLDTTKQNHLSIYHPQLRSTEEIFVADQISKIAFAEKTNHLAFTSRPDSIKNEISTNLHIWAKDQKRVELVGSSDSKFLDKNWHLHRDSDLKFSKDSKFLFFGIGQEPIKRDSSLLDEDIVNLEIWSYNENVLHTEQKVKLKKELKRNYSCAYNLSNRKVIQIGNKDFPEVKFSAEDSETALLYNDTKYRRTFSWEGINYKESYVYNLSKGSKKLIAKKEEGNMSVSPFGKYVYWYSRPDSTWKSYDVKKSKIKEIAGNQISIFYDEKNDRPMLPYSYRMATWINNDEYLIIYDRYDLWKIDPSNKKKAVRLTDGREKKIIYRYVSLEKEQQWIDGKQKILLHVFNENDKSSGYVSLDLSSSKMEMLDHGDFDFSKRIWKAKNNETVLFTKENFKTFPNLIKSNLNFENQIQISDVNPQQDDYKWGSGQLVSWESKSGKTHEGMLFVPEDFDRDKKYPMIVNFYERSSNNLNQHRAPKPHRSTINYTFFVNKGYVVFNPDVHYEVGYPGKSCYNSVMSGVDHIVAMGFIDEDKIGLQGHSWGGYQVAHLITKTNRFACAESGAPVVNMISAYGGIRWRSGLSRMFQYEHTQSRLGATLWENKELYLENSPVFNLDKVNTPVLILHNDKDGAVPWYQGIEFFVGMRRLEKPAWLLNYNDEPHWPVKRQNRVDFNTRMHQFFDHYLMDKPMPQWMKRGIPAKEKGILQGLEIDR